MAKLAHQKNLPGRFSIPAHHRATLGGVEAFGSVKAERTAVAMFEQGAAIKLDPQSMRRVINNLKPVAVCDDPNLRHVAGVTIDMRRQDGVGFGGARIFDLGVVDTEGLRLYVHKHWLAAFPQNSVGGGNITIRRGDDLALDAQRLNGDLKRESTVANEFEVLKIEMSLQALSQFAAKWAVV